MISMTRNQHCKSSLLVDVASNGLNLQKAAKRVISMVPAKRANPQIQAENRVLRVDQENDVEIVRAIVKNSHDQFREARRTSNVRLEIASKAHLPAMREELVLVLDEAQQKLRELRETERARALLDEMDRSDSSAAEQVQSQGSKVSSARQTPRKPASRGLHHLNSVSQSLSELDSNARISESEDQLVPGSDNNAGEYEADENDEDNDNEIATSVPGEEEDEDDTITGVEEEDLPNILAMTREARENLDLDDLFLRVMLKLDCNYEYTEKNLENETVLDRAIDLLRHKRQGQNQ